MNVIANKYNQRFYSICQTEKITMTVQEIKNWYKEECGKEIPSGWDANEKDCLDFITSCISSDLYLQAILAQAEGNTEKLINTLWLVKCQCEEWIKELKAMEE